MSGLQKATLQALKGEPGSALEGQPVAVQFNPSSLRIQFQSHTAGGVTPGAPVKAHTGDNSTLTLDLHFDSADEGTTDAPVNVRQRTAQVARFVLPRPHGDPKQGPPRVRFHWGDLIYDGVMSSLSEDLDLFAASGVPLRAKVSIAILGQDPKVRGARDRARGGDGRGRAASRRRPRLRRGVQRRPRGVGWLRRLDRRAARASA